MLAQFLALLVALGSFALYMAAFFFPEVHRKYDFVFSGCGLFYALVLWVCAQRITGGVLLGQVASVALLGWFGWQTLSLRRELVPEAEQTPVPEQATSKARSWLTPNQWRSRLSGLFQRQSATGLQSQQLSEAIAVEIEPGTLTETERAAPDSEAASTGPIASESIVEAPTSPATANESAVTASERADPPATADAPPTNREPNSSFTPDQTDI
ncbi:Ycf66 family protein [Rubidibacter lacunae KORDI 51-2]|uniref:Ycf66 family protein n=2 Tax=Rubidibacter TaxID=582491 RepID=U5DMT9_9CHRO|nr:Ycf66 family protein [Rubidibacter lacunae KORDI 51-2]